MTRLRLPWRLHTNTLAGISLILTVFSLIFYRRAPVVFFVILLLSVLLDVLVWRLRPKHDQGARLADWTSDRLAEGVLFAVFWNPWLFLFVLNCFLMLYSFLKRETFIMPLRHIFLIYFLFSHILHVV